MEKAKKIVKAQQIKMKRLKEEKEKLQDEVGRLEPAVATQRNGGGWRLNAEGLQKQENGSEKMQSLLNPEQALGKVQI